MRCYPSYEQHLSCTGAHTFEAQTPLCFTTFAYLITQNVQYTPLMDDLREATKIYIEEAQPARDCILPMICGEHLCILRLHLCGLLCGFSNSNNVMRAWRKYITDRRDDFLVGRPCGTSSAEPMRYYRDQVVVVPVSVNNSSLRLDLALNN